MRSSATRREHRRHVEHRLGEDRRALDQRSDDAGLVAERVEERVDDQVAVAGGEADDRSTSRRTRAAVWPCVVITPFGRPVVPEVKMMSESVVGGHRRRPGPGRGRVDRRSPRARKPAQSSVPAGASPRSTTIRSSAGSRLVGERGDVVGAEETADAEQQPGPRLVKHVRRFAALEAGVQRDEDTAGTMGAERGDDPFVDVRGPDRDSVAAVQPEADERPRGPLDLCRQFGERPSDLSIPIAIDESLAVELRCRSSDHLRNRPPLDREAIRFARCAAALGRWAIRFARCAAALGRWAIRFARCAAALGRWAIRFAHRAGTVHRR